MLLEEVNGIMDALDNQYSEDLNKFGIDIDKFIYDKTKLPRPVSDLDLIKLNICEFDACRILVDLSFSIENYILTHKYTLVSEVEDSIHWIKEIDNSNGQKDLLDSLQLRYSKNAAEIKKKAEQVEDIRKGTNKFIAYLRLHLKYDFMMYWSNTTDKINYTQRFTPKLKSELFNLIHGCFIYDISKDIKAGDIAIVNNELIARYKGIDNKLSWYIHANESIYKILHCTSPALILHFTGLGDINNRETWPWKDTLVQELIQKLKGFDISANKLLKLKLLDLDYKYYDGLDILRSLNILQIKLLLERVANRNGWKVE